MKKLIMLLTGLTLLFFSAKEIKAQTRPGSLKGIITDANSGEIIPFANVVLKDFAGNVVTGGNSDISGKYHINPIQPGTYDVTVTFTGYATITLQRINILPDKTTIQDFKMQPASEMLEEVVITFEKPLISPTKNSYSISAEPIMEMATRDVSSMASPPAIKARGSDKEVAAEGRSIRGARSEGTVYFIDGVKIRGTVNVPQAAIQKVEIITGGLPAQYGDHPNPLTEYDIDFTSPSSIEFSGRKRETEKPEANARILTAGEIHDFSKWKLWEDISEEELKTHKSHWEVASINRYSVQLTFAGGTPVVDAEVWLIDNSDKVTWQSRTDNTGKAELWSSIFEEEKDSKPARLEIRYSGKVYTIEDPIPFESGLNILEIGQSCELPLGIDISFVVDATGSMGDEIAYLKAELKDVIQRVENSMNNADIRLSSVFYRDQGDAYVTKKTDFSSKIDNTIKFIKDQSAGGGGDYPEAVIEALEVAVDQLSWRDEAASRIIFLVLDAPPHHDNEKVQQLHRLIRLAAKKGIRIIPIASSGIDKSTEYLLRSMALATNGTYTFLTNHSGVGNPHIEPTTDSYTVELLNDLMVRLIHQFTFIPKCVVPKKPDTLATTRASDTLKTALKVAEGTPEYKGDFNWRVYPNPTTGPLRVEFNERVKELYVTDLRGKIISRRELGRIKETNIDLSSFPVGTYFIMFEWEGKVVTEQIILIH